MEKKHFPRVSIMFIFFVKLLFFSHILQSDHSLNATLFEWIFEHTCYIEPALIPSGEAFITMCPLTPVLGTRAPFLESGPSVYHSCPKQNQRT